MLRIGDNRPHSAIPRRWRSKFRIQFADARASGVTPKSDVLWELAAVSVDSDCHECHRLFVIRLKAKTSRQPMCVLCAAPPPEGTWWSAVGFLTRRLRVKALSWSRCSGFL